MGRILVILGPALLLAGCNNDDHMELYRTATVTVINKGTESAFGRGEDWDGETKVNFTLPPGASTSFEIVISYRLKLHVWRTSDSLLLIDDFWELQDLKDLDDQVTVTVTP